MPTEITSGFAPGDDEKVVQFLRNWDGGPLSNMLFTALAGIIPQPIIEAPVLRANDNVVETILIPRPIGDPIWPGMVHTPGVALRVSDFDDNPPHPLDHAFRRIEKEIGWLFATQPEFVMMHHWRSIRGPEVCQIYLARVKEEAELLHGAYWYPIQDLPNHRKFVVSQLSFIFKVEEYFKEHYM